MSNPDSSINLVLNGEIYNFQELRRELEKKYRFRSKTDTEVVVHGYAEWGPDVIGKLDGMFALALWDAGAGTLLLARDRFGKKPLFWARDERAFYFASEIKAILAAGHKAEMAAETLPEYLALGYVPSTRTMFRDIHKLPPAAYAVVGLGLDCTPKTYWDWPMPGRDATATQFRGGKAAAMEELDRLFSAAVAKRLVSDVPLGILLSGGVDSTAVALYAQKWSGAPVRTFTMGFSGDGEYDERPHAELVARTLGTIHVSEVLKPEATAERIETLLHHHDEPFGDPSALPTFLVAAKAREHVTVVLNGDGGDELFAGYPRFGAALLAENIPGSVRRALSDLARRVPSESKTARKARRFLRKAARPAAERLFEWCSIFSPEEVRQMLPDFHTEMNVERSYASAYQAAAGASTLNRLLYTNARTYLLDDLLPKVDRMTMAHGLEARSPFLDISLAEFAATLPDEYKWSGMSGKRILKSLLAPSFPKGFLDRPKQGFGIPLDRWLRNELRPLVSDLLAPSARLRTFVARGEVDRIQKEHYAGTHDHGFQIWTLITLELWLRKHAA